MQNTALTETVAGRPPDGNSLRMAQMAMAAADVALRDLHCGTLSRNSLKKSSGAEVRHRKHAQWHTQRPRKTSTVAHDTLS